MKSKLLYNKTYKRIILSFVLLFLACCSVIDKDDTLIDYTPPIPEGADVRYIVLEDYTGMRCSNCPKAASKASLLKETYKERLIPVSIHAGYFARPINGYDLRSSEGEEYNNYYGITGNPQGIVNRTSYKGSAYYPVDSWAGAVETVPDKASFGIDISVEYDNKTRSCIIIPEVTRFMKTVKDDINIIIWLIEDNIVTPQIIENGSVVEEYLQRHVLRKSLTGAWGVAALLPEYIGSSSLQKQAEYTIPTDYKEQDCSIVVLLCDNNSKEILQAKEVPLILSEQ